MTCKPTTDPRKHDGPHVTEDVGGLLHWMCEACGASLDPIDGHALMTANYHYAAHYNMGRNGYGYGYRCEEFPRISFIDRDYRPTKENPDARMVREWYVDGAKVESVEAAARALAKPPTLTDDEKRILESIPPEFVPARKLEDDLAGVERPSGGIKSETPHSRVLRVLYVLHAKGLIQYGKTPERDDGKPWSDAVPEHMRWSPTIRRRKA
jgi:hypothetical protein